MSSIHTHLTIRQCRARILANGLKCITVNDIHADKSSAAVVVGSGSRDDGQVQGLAHCVEHMLFLGTAEYKDDIWKYLASHGGSGNAYTSYDDTRYFFACNHDALGDALHRFSSFFRCPTLDKDALLREVHAIDAEYHKDRLHDGRRLWQVVKSQAFPDDPFAGFPNGNIDTLLPNRTIWNKSRSIDRLHKAVQRYFSDNYTGNNMTVCVVSNASLDMMDNMIDKCFSSLKSGRSRTFDEQHPFPPSSLGRIVAMKPIMATKSLDIMFPMPVSSSNEDLELSGVLSRIILSEHSGSLMDGLKSSGQISNGSAGLMYAGSRFSMFGLSFELAKNSNYDRIIDETFHYLKSLRAVASQSHDKYSLPPPIEINDLWCDSVVKSVNNWHGTDCIASTIRESTISQLSHLLQGDKEDAEAMAMRIATVCEEI